MLAGRLCIYRCGETTFYSIVIQAVCTVIAHVFPSAFDPIMRILNGFMIYDGGSDSHDGLKVRPLSTAHQHVVYNSSAPRTMDVQDEYISHRGTRAGDMSVAVRGGPGLLSSYRLPGELVNAAVPYAVPAAALLIRDLGSVLAAMLGPDTLPLAVLELLGLLLDEHNLDLGLLDGLARIEYRVPAPALLAIEDVQVAMLDPLAVFLAVLELLLGLLPDVDHLDLGLLENVTTVPPLRIDAFAPFARSALVELSVIRPHSFKLAVPPPEGLLELSTRVFDGKGGSCRNTEDQEHCQERR